MRLIELISLFIGSSTIDNWPSYTAWPRYFRSRAPQGTPPTDYEVLTQQELLSQFSDAQGRSAITPRALRNFVASTITTTPGGTPPSIPLPLPGWTTATRPVGMIGPAIGFNYDLQTLDMWDDKAGVWVNPSFNGGTVTGFTTFAGGVTLANPINLVGLPGSTTGLPEGRMWNNGWMAGITS